MRRLAMGLLVSAALCAPSAVAVAPAGAASCPNEAIREQQGSTFLPDCRAYEIVSPGAAKGGGFIFSGYTPIAPSGEKVVYEDGSPFGDATQGFLQMAYLAQRTGSGWHSTFMQNVPLPETFLNTGPRELLTFTPSWMGASQDLSHVYSNINYWAEPDFTSGTWQTDDDGAASVAVERRPPSGETDLGTLMPEPVGASADGSHLVVSSPILNDEPSGSPYLYEKVGSSIRMVNVDDEGNPILGSGGGGAELAGESTDAALTAISEDGSHIYFMSAEGTSSQLYLRLDGTTTYAASDAAVGGESPAQGIEFVGASSDGEIAYFTSTSKVLPDMSGTGPFLYRWRPTAGGIAGSIEVVAGEDHPVELQERGAPLGAQVLVDHDGGVFYYETTDAGGSIYRSDGTSSTLVASEVGEVILREGRGNSSSLSPQERGRAYITPDGRYLVFRSKAVGLAGSGDTNTGYKLYRYAFGLQGVQLVSTGPTAPDASFDSEMDSNGASEGSGTTSSGSSQQKVTPAQYFISDDGKYVFFQTAAQLVARDENQATDVYEWREGEGVRLISGGKGELPSNVAGATPDGSSVFFYTSADLVPQDGDDMLDLYAARTDGGFYEPSRQVCSGESCQPGAPAAATPQAPASASFSAPPSAPGKSARPPVHCGAGKKQKSAGAKKKPTKQKKAVTRKRARQRRAGAGAKRCAAPRVKHHGKHHRKHGKSKQGGNR